MQTKKPSILFLGTQMALGGAQTVQLTQADWFHKQSYPVTVAFFYDKEGFENRWKSDFDFRVINLKGWTIEGKKFSNYLRLIISLFRLLRLILKNKFDIVETFGIDSNIFGIPIAFICGVKNRIGTHHGYTGITTQSRLKLHSLIINSKLTTYLITVSDALKTQVINNENISAHKVKVIKNGIQLFSEYENSPVSMEAVRASLNISRDEHVVLSVGRLVIEKGFQFLIEAIPQVLEVFPNTVFIIVGGGHMKDTLNITAQKLGIEKSLRLIGKREDIRNILQSSDIFVLPSLSEGLSIAIMEAMNVGLPVIASRVGGIPEIIQHETNGFLISPKSSDAIADSIIDLLKNDAVRKRMGQAAKVHIKKNFTLEGMALKYEKLFYELMF
ncbi:MAG: glycosyltransferase family 4 protein [Chloroflexi bacterium]|nr:glycosyltransferase family 4 protein [Chloroflexota bacterium]